MSRCGFCGDPIGADEGYWVHDNGDLRHQECGDDVAQEEPLLWMYVEEEK